MNVSDTVQRSGSITKTLICVDSVQNCEPSGFLYNPYMPNRTAFFGYFSFIRVMDGFFDRMQCPQAYQKYRVWKAGESGERRTKEEVTRFMAEETFRPGKGGKATFTIQVQFRQNATWQGTLAWMENKKVQQFRSVLEMVKLMDKALAESGSSNAVGWESSKIWNN